LHSRRAQSFEHHCMETPAKSVANSTKEIGEDRPLSATTDSLDEHGQSTLDGGQGNSQEVINRHPTSQQRDQVVPAQEVLRPPHSLSGACTQLRAYWATLVLGLITCGAIGFTIFFAYNASLEQPVVDFIILSRPEMTILFLSGASHVSVFLIGAFAARVLENVRWTFASREEGVSALCTLTLSPATGYLGVLTLLVHGLSLHTSHSRPWKFQPPKVDNHRIWAFQR